MFAFAPLVGAKRKSISVVDFLSDQVAKVVHAEAEQQRKHAQSQLDTQSIYPGRTPPGSHPSSGRVVFIGR
jgi:hypothetical protein